MSSEKVDGVINTNDFHYAGQIPRLLLIPLGIWPVKRDYPKFLKHALIIYCSLITLFSMIPLTLFILFDAPNFTVNFSF